jgi:hypothetical protein
VPLLRANIKPETPQDCQATLNCLEYTSVMGAIFNDFLMNRFVRITPENIEDYEAKMKELLLYYNKWRAKVFAVAAIPSSIAVSNPEKHFISNITYNILRTSIRGFFEYCRIAFAMAHPPEFVMVSHSNSSSIEAVFSYVRRMQRDTPQGFVTAVTSQNSTDAIKLLASQGKKSSYDHNDIPDSASPAKGTIGQRNNERDEFFRKVAKPSMERKEIGANHTALDTIFGDTTWSLSPAYSKLANHLDKLVLPKVAQGFDAFLLNDDTDFIGTTKAAAFTQHQKWFEALSGLSADDQMRFDRSCARLLKILLEMLDKASQKRRGRNRNDSYQFRVYRFLVERTTTQRVDWDHMFLTLPQSLQTDSLPVCLLVLHFSDVLLEWVRETVSFQLTAKTNKANASGSTSNENKEEEEELASDDDHESLVENVNRFVGWAIFSLIKKMERNYGENEAKLALLESMQVYEHDIILDSEYMESCYAERDQLRNQGGLTLVSKDFFEFGKQLMREVSKFTIATFKARGNAAAKESHSLILNNETLASTFRLQCRQLFPEEEEQLSDGDISSVYESICTKVFRAWGGEQHRKLKEGYTGRQVKTSSNTTLRGFLNVVTKQGTDAS